MGNPDQLALVQIGAMVSQFYPDGRIPESLTEVVKVVGDRLGIRIERGGNIQSIRDNISEALSQHKASQVMDFK